MYTLYPQAYTANKGREDGWFLLAIPTTACKKTYFRMDSTLSMKEYQGLVCICSVHNSDAHETQTHVSSLPFNWSSASTKFTTVSPGGMRSTGGRDR